MPAEVEGNPGAESECSRPRRLSRRQRQVLELAAQGLKIEEMGERMRLQAPTVGHHLERARLNVGARTTAQAVALAIIRGLIEVGEPAG